MRVLSYADALREAMFQEMEKDSNVFLMGEDIGVYGGAFGVTRGLLDRFGEERVINTPICELGFVGVGVGAALMGCRPVVEIMFMDFIALAMDQLVNQAANLHYVFGDQANCPLVIRAVGGGGKSYGPTHSQCLERWFFNTPGLKVVVPATPQDAKGLLIQSIRDNNPVIFMEHKLLYQSKGEVDEETKPILFGKAQRVRSGRDLTIIAYSWMSLQAIKAAQELSQIGIDVDLIDLRTLCPLDHQSIMDSVKKTGRALLVEEGNRTGGVSAEIGFQIFEELWEYLDGPIRRVTAPDIPIPASPVLEDAALPSVQTIVEAAVALMKE